MKKCYLNLLTIFVILLFTSCEKEDDKSDDSINLIVKIPLTYKDNFWGQSAQYEAVKIGEYLWMNSNFNHYEETPVTQEQINRILKNYRININDYQISIPNFNKYYGQYYSRFVIEHMYGYGEMYEGYENKLITTKDQNGNIVRTWKLPSPEDFQQLFAMCGDASEISVRHALSAKVGQNPAAMDIPETYWFQQYNTNKYGFNMMPSGARFHAGTSWGTCFSPNDCPTFFGEAGDFYFFFMAVRWPADGGKTVSIHDYVTTSEDKLWHLLPVRWCRKLSNEELGYKLYINEEKTDIKKLNLNEIPPAGYRELPNGYLRGFYVQYLLDNPQPIKTVSQLVDMAKKLR